MTTYRSIFGPVRSSRLGLSLGLDLLGAPICSMDCLYCEVGKTRTLTRERRRWVRGETVLAELSAYSRENRAPEVVTLGGLGEPCLNLDMGMIIEGARKIYPGLPVAVLTNATLLTDATVRAELMGADIVLPSLDSLVEDEFAAVNRPAAGITAAACARGIMEFRELFAGRIFLEVLLCKGLNDSQANLEMLADYVGRISPDRVDVVTLSRPGAYAEATAADTETLARFAGRLGAKPRAADRQIEAGRASKAETASSSPLTDEAFREIVLSSLRRRPQTPGQISDALGVDEERVRALLHRLESEGAVTCDDTFYALARD